jgi:hypothetical protein
VCGMAKDILSLRAAPFVANNDADALSLRIKRRIYFLAPFFFCALALISRSAASRAAARTSGFSLRFFASTSKEAPTSDRVNALLLTRRFFERVLASMSCKIA